LWIGVPLVSKSESTINHRPWYLVVTWLKSNGLSVCWVIPQQSQKPGHDWTTSSTWCMPNVHLFIG